ncbi:MAG: radical SAM protein [Candidatus Bathyarchaeia archaeon]
MKLIEKFDPWHSSLCTCPPKLTFNPYTGCDHMCIYCYATSYIPNFTKCTPKRNLETRLRKEAQQLKGETLSMSNSSDPYPNKEAKLEVTRRCLQILAKANCKIQIITKSDTVTRDIDLLEKVPSMVELTITTENDSTAKLLEPNAPPPSARLKAAQTLIAKGIPVAVRVDPVIPHVNDHPERLIKTLAEMGVKHVTASTYKIRPDSWQRLAKALPETAKQLESLYYGKGTKIGGYLYLPRELRLKLMKNIADLSKQYGMKFGTCREGLAELNTAACDGSWLLKPNHG